MSSCSWKTLGRLQGWFHGQWPSLEPCPAARSQTARKKLLRRDGRSRHCAQGHGQCVLQDLSLPTCLLPCSRAGIAHKPLFAHKPLCFEHRLRSGVEFSFQVKTSPHSPELVFLVTVPPCTLRSHFLAAIFGLSPPNETRSDCCYIWVFSSAVQKKATTLISPLQNAAGLMVSAWKLVPLHQVILCDEFLLLSYNPVKSLAWLGGTLYLLSWGFPEL